MWKNPGFARFWRDFRALSQVLSNPPAVFIDAAVMRHNSSFSAISGDISVVGNIEFVRMS